MNLYYFPSVDFCKQSASGCAISKANSREEAARKIQKKFFDHQVEWSYWDKNLLSYTPEQIKEGDWCLEDELEKYHEVYTELMSYKTNCIVTSDDEEFTEFVFGSE
jgi:hypothetical protein